MAPRQTVARTIHEADSRNHTTANVDVSKLSAAEKAKWTQFSNKFARPGDVAWMGPCETTDGGRTRVVCYFDANMDASDCRNQPC